MRTSVSLLSDCSQQVINHLEVWSIWWNKTRFFPRCHSVNTTEWMHYVGTNKMHGENARWELHKNAVLKKAWKQLFTKQQLFSHWPPISQIMQVRWMRHAGHSWRSKAELKSNLLLWDPYSWTGQCWLTSKNLFTSARCRHWIKFGRPERSDE